MDKDSVLHPCKDVVLANTCSTSANQQQKGTNN